MRQAKCSSMVLLAVSAMCLLLVAPAGAWTTVSNCLNCHSDFLEGNPSMHGLH